MFDIFLPSWEKDNKFQTLFERVSATHKPMHGTIHDSEIFMLIGRFIVVFQHLEWTIEGAICSSTGLHNTLVATFFAESRFSDILATLQRVNVLIKSCNDKELKTACIRAKQISEIRNKLIHATWIGGGKSEGAITLRKTKSHKGGVRIFGDISRNDLELLIQETQKVDCVISGMFMPPYNNKIPHTRVQA